MNHSDILVNILELTPLLLSYANRIVDAGELAIQTEEDQRILAIDKEASTVTHEVTRETRLRRVQALQQFFNLTDHPYYENLRSIKLANKRIERERERQAIYKEQSDNLNPQTAIISKPKEVVVIENNTSTGTNKAEETKSIKGKLKKLFRIT